MKSTTRILIAAIAIASCGIGCDKPEVKTPPTSVTTRAASTHPASTIRFLALGDSYTIGESVEPDDRWPVRLAAALHAEGVDVAPPVIVAVTGYTTGDLVKKLDREPVAGRFDLVSLMMGVNNEYQGLSEDEFAQEFDELLRRSAIYARGDIARVVVLSIPDWGMTPFGKHAGRGHEVEDISQPIDRFNAIAHAHTIAAGASWIDVTTETRTVGDDPSLLARDELHYSRKMLEKWASLTLPAARVALGLPTIAATRSATTQP